MNKFNCMCVLCVYFTKNKIEYIIKENQERTLTLSIVYDKTSNLETKLKISLYFRDQYNY